MDNQHGLNSLAYLAGIIDGDGHMNLAVRNKSGHKTIIPSLEICNTNAGMIAYCQDIIKSIGVISNYFVNTKTGGKPYHCLIVRSQRRCSRVLKEIIPFLVEKKTRASILVDFCDWRNSSSRDYNEKDWEFVADFNEARTDEGEMPTSVNPAYLAGLVDSEGTISLKGARHLRNGKLSAIAPSIRFANTNKVLADYVSFCFISFGSNPYRGCKRLGSGKDYHEIAVNGIAKVKRVLSKLKNHLVGKLVQAESVLEFANYRLGLQKEGTPKQRYGEFELGLMAKVRALNR